MAGYILPIQSFITRPGREDCIGQASRTDMVIGYGESLTAPGERLVAL